MRRIIPNGITCLSLICGSISIYLTISNEIKWAGICILFAAVFDFLDGFFARLLHSISTFGKVFDSLADLVSFGVAPAAIVFMLLRDIVSNPSGLSDIPFSFPFDGIPYFSMLLILASAIRLAKFTSSDDQNRNFKGLPTTAAGIFIASLAIISITSNRIIITNLLSNAYTWLLILVVISAMEVLNLPMVNLKFQNYTFKDNVLNYVLLFILLLLLLKFRWLGIPLMFVVYVFVSLFLFIMKSFR